MHYHAHAALTRRQRTHIQQLYAAGISQAELARRFGVHRRTIQRWIGRTDTMDRSSAPHHHGRQVVTEQYRAAVLAARHAQPRQGPKRIAHDLRDRFPTANATTVWRILHAAGLSRRLPKKTPSSSPASRTPSGADGYSRTPRHSRRAQT